jgi:hypothetical protein
MVLCKDNSALFGFYLSETKKKNIPHISYVFRCLEIGNLKKLKNLNCIETYSRNKGS